MNTANQTSALVGGFEHVTVASGLTCPNCGKSFGPHDLCRNSDDLRLRCAGCERDAISATFIIDEEGE